ncbi:hypothetical protein MSG28_005094 [Choristoneura fumiferana]|uniref:Uncharacterized protein n=1 Tax=Choristoneura fumiferana TaxID=7141 RepID=A0ACC0JPN6_CHOFU|nr:hypothetical protein MSG28_005094 [Choristoneura fumiferana]
MTLASVRGVKLYRARYGRDRSEKRELANSTHLRGELCVPAQGYRHFASGAAGRAPAPALAAPSTDPARRAAPPAAVPRPQSRKTLFRRIFARTHQLFAHITKV